MAEIRAALLPATDPLWVRRAPASLADVSLLPFRRGLFFLTALSLPVLGCVAADRFHGSASGMTQVVAALPTPPHGGVATKFPSGGRPFAQAKFAQSLSVQ